MLKILYILIFSVLGISIIGQDIDSLLVFLKQNQSDSIKSNTFYKIANLYNKRNSLDSALLFSKKSSELSQKLNLTDITFFNKELEAMVLIKKSKYSEAEILLQSITNQLLNAKISDSSRKIHLLSTYISLGIINTINNNTAKALNYYLEGVKNAKSLRKKDALARLYNNIGNIYISEEDDSLAIVYLHKAQKIYEETKDYGGLSKTKLNLGNISRYNKRFQDAIDTYQDAQLFSLKINDSVTYALLQNRIALSYVELYENTTIEESNKATEINLLNKNELLDKALIYYQNSRKILKNNKRSIEALDNKIAKIYFYQKQYSKAINIYSSNVKKLDLYAINTKIIAIKGLKESYEKLNNFKLSLKWNEELARLKDTIKVRENLKEFGKRQAELSHIKTKEIADFKHKTDVEQLNNENEKKELVAKNEKRKQQYIIWTIAIGLIVIGLFLIIMIRRWKITKAQKEIINHQKELIEKEKLATEDSISYAKNIQKAAFPSLNEVNSVIPNNFILFKPKDIVSGDFYWANQINNKKFIALADCTGHGVPGAFMTLISLNILNQIIADGVETPQGILQQLHLRLQKRLSKTSKHGLDLAICMIDGNKLTYSGVHIPLYHIRNGILTEYKGQKFQLGSGNPTLFQQHEILFQKNDTFYISTDGFPDQKGGQKGKKYFYPTFRKKLTNIVELNLEEQRKELDIEFTNWKGKQEQLDDVSVIGFRI